MSVTKQKYPARALVTATPPTPNGDLHVGHLSGPYLGADIHTRYLRMRGVQAFYLSGIDDHQSYTSLKAEQTNSTPERIADHYAREITSTLSAAGITPDHIYLPRSSSRYLTFISDFCKRLYEEGKVVARETPSLYCANCERYLFEAYVRGRCPHCGAGSGGNACEDCGQPNDCIDLGEPFCNRCNSQPVTRVFNRLYFPLERYRSALLAYCSAAAMNPHLRSLCDQMFAKELPEIAVSHLSDWGIPVPVPGFNGQTLYVWFEMAPGYLAGTEALSEKLGLSQGWKEFWQHENSEVIQFFGFDNGYFHTLLFPALFFAYDATIKPAQSFVLNEFYRLDGLKFSTSRNHAIWGRELLNDQQTDAVRFYLCYSAPEAEQTNFTLDEFRTVTERELEQTWRPWLEELSNKVLVECSGISPAAGVWTSEHRLFRDRLTRLASDAGAAYEAKTFSPQTAARLLCELVRSARRFGQLEEHWRNVPGRVEERRNGILLELAASRTLAVLAAPMMPEFAARLWHGLGFETEIKDVRWPELPELVPSGQRIEKLGW